MSTASTPAPPSEPPKPVNPEPVSHEEKDPEKGSVPTPPREHSEHPRQAPVRG